MVPADILAVPDFAYWAAVVIIGYPLLSLVLLEVQRRIESAYPDIVRLLRVLQYAVLPGLAAWILIHKLTTFASDSLSIKLIDTVVGIVVLYGVLLTAQTILALAATRIPGRVGGPKLFYELAGFASVLVGGAIIVSTVWGIELGTLFGALGVGSLVLGLALQNVIGGLASGLIVLSGRKFTIGDWLDIDGTYRKVLEVDWRSVTLQEGNGTLVVPSSSIASSKLKVRKEGQPVAVSATITLPATFPPARVKEALLEAARDIPHNCQPGEANWALTAYAGTALEHTVALSVDDPTKAAEAKALLLKRIWYACQRHGIDLTGAPSEGPTLFASGKTAEQRAALLAETGALRAGEDELAELARACRLEAYASGEVLLHRRDEADHFYVVLDGELSLNIGTDEAPVVVDTLGPREMFAIREIFRKTPSPVTVGTEVDTQVIAIPAAAMRTVLDRNPRLAGDLDAAMDSRAESVRSLVRSERRQRARLRRVV
ncbi:cyclic nucleotide-binding domain-containing protein [Marinivivus vitaminiproducens]|uniref:cyclic nucleotide-binding domain-containing protein n=1 Tax=Marinivivus vitaminiproducens TaxID=3035935 RepID=UPI00279A8315|nr:mechanosensitive ion channel family protein [Geminicoccaceae bacterium SCSIO 64248]